MVRSMLLSLICSHLQYFPCFELEGYVGYLLILRSVIDDKKAKPSATDSPSSNSITSPGPVVTQLDDNARDTFGTGRPLEDNPELILCKHCKKSILKSSAKAHVDSCLANKKELQRKRKEAKEKAKAKAEGGESKAGDDDDKDPPAKDSKDGAKDVKEKKEKIKKSDKEKDKAKESDKVDKATLDEEGDTRMGGNDDDDDDTEPVEEATPAPKKTPSGLKSAKKTAGKKAGDDGEKKGKKRKLDADAEKGPKAKKKKEEPKLKAPKPKGKK
jgi:SAGA-associated factor 73